MFSEVLDNILGQRSKVRILRLLLRSHAQLTGRQIARQTDLNHATCHAALRDLARYGIVLRITAGTAHLYRLNEEHVLVKDVLSRAFGAEADLLDDYADTARRALRIPVESVIVYGSVARGAKRPESDVDLLFVLRDGSSAEKGRKLLGPLAASLARKFGRVPHIVFTNRRAFRANVRRRNPFYSSIVQDGRALFGMSLPKLLRNGS